MILYNEKYDFLPVYESIKKFYPLGLAYERNDLLEHASAHRRISDLLKKNYPGIEALYQIVVDKIHDDEKFKSISGSLHEKIEQVSQLKVIGTTYGQAPCFSGFIELEKNSIGDLTRYKMVHFFISLVGPYYSVIGVDSSRILTSRVFLTNQLIASPENEYAQIFSTIEEKISEQFSGYKFLPFEVCNYELQGFYAPYTNDTNCCKIFNALFNDQIDFRANIKGDEMYGGEKWMRDDYDPGNEGGWIIYNGNIK